MGSASRSQLIGKNIRLIFNSLKDLEGFRQDCRCYSLIEVDEVVRQAGEHMATKKNAKSATKKAPSPEKKAAPECTTPKRVRPAVKRAAPAKTRSKSALVTKLLDAAEKKVEADEVKASIGDVIRLLQLQKELEQEEPREITVQWISREEKKHVSEK